MYSELFQLVPPTPVTAPISAPITPNTSALIGTPNLLQKKSVSESEGTKCYINESVAYFQSEILDKLTQSVKRISQVAPRTLKAGIHPYENLA